MITYDPLKEAMDRAKSENARHIAEGRRHYAKLHQKYGAEGNYGEGADAEDGRRRRRRRR